MWQSELVSAIDKKDWVEAIRLIDNESSTTPGNLTIDINAIYTFHHVLLEGDPQSLGLDVERLQMRLLSLYNDSNSRYGEVAEYLFFVGVISQVAEWLFGEISAESGRLRVKKAADLEPSNILYAWGVLYSRALDVSLFSTSRLIVDSQHDVFDWLDSYAFAGAYIKDRIIWCAQYPPRIYVGGSE